MKITSEIYRIEKVVTGTVELEIDDQMPTYIEGKSGGDCFVACFIPRWCPKHKQVGDEWVEDDDVQFLGFLVISRNQYQERSVQINVGNVTVWNDFVRDLKTLPHGEDIVEFVATGTQHNIRTCTEKSFYDQLRKWRII